MSERPFDIPEGQEAETVCFGDFSDNADLNDENIDAIVDRISGQMRHCRDDHGSKHFASLWLCGTSDDDIAIFCDDLMNIASMGINEKDERGRQEIDAVFHYLLAGLKKLREERSRNAATNS